jgi:Family of unknown function (DUF6247)
MSAEPVQDEDPNDPLVILRDLPEQERAQFLRQYHEAVDAAHNPAGYRRLQRLLRTWRLTAITTSSPGYYEEIEAVRTGAARTVPADEAIPGWQERLAEARALRQ